MLIGVDFDNTIVCYDDIFWNAARERQLIPQDSRIAKGEIRDLLRQSEREQDWLELQGHVYGRAIQQAKPYPGVLEFFQHMRSRENPLCIISHKARKPFAGPAYDLQQAALDWLQKWGFTDPDVLGLTRGDVYFGETPRAKLELVMQLKPDFMIDDLPEFLLEPEFPSSTLAILFDPNGVHSSAPRLHRLRSWDAVTEFLDSRMRGTIPAGGA